MNLDLSDQEVESDKEGDGTEEIVVDDASGQSAQPREEIVLSSSGATSGSSSSSLSSSSESGEEEDARGDDGSPSEQAALATDATGRNNEAKGSLDLTDSDGYFVSSEDPTAVATELNASEAKLIGGQMIGSLCFKSGDQEHRFLHEASGYG